MEVRPWGESLRVADTTQPSRTNTTSNENHLREASCRKVSLLPLGEFRQRLDYHCQGRCRFCRWVRGGLHQPWESMVVPGDCPPYIWLLTSTFRAVAVYAVLITSIKENLWLKACSREDWTTGLYSSVSPMFPLGGFHLKLDFNPKWGVLLDILSAAKWLGIFLEGKPERKEWNLHFPRTSNTSAHRSCCKTQELLSK